jgi:hypothetical protein
MRFCWRIHVLLLLRKPSSAHATAVAAAVDLQGLLGGSA